MTQLDIFIKIPNGTTLIANNCKNIEDIKQYVYETIGIPHVFQNYICPKTQDNQSTNEITLYLNYGLKGGGIPSYFRQIIKEHPNTHFWKNGMKVDDFYIDFNAMIYQVIILLGNQKQINNYETVLQNAIIKHLQHVICEVIKPTTSVFIAVDGPPPRAKMVQQRARRYKAIKESNYREELDKKYKLETKTTWNKSSISPGTYFMSKLSKMIISAIRDHALQVHNEKLIVTFSDESIPGEGEHKILQKIRQTQSQSQSDNKQTTVIYSPDADLIVLSVLSHVPNIYILREPKDSELELKLYKDYEFLYLSIDACRQAFEKMVNYVEGDCDSVMRDYSFLTFLCGNDFVVASPFLKMKEGGIQILIDIYRDLAPEYDSLIIFDGVKLTINMLFFVRLLQELKEVETAKLQKWQKKRDRIRRGEKEIKTYENKEPWEIDMLHFQHEEYYSPLNPYYEKFNRVFDKIDYFSPDWNNQYNKHFFNTTESINDVCHEYLKSLEFCLMYYFDSPPSWTWFYPYRAAPTIGDFLNYIIINNPQPTKFELNEPCSQFEQLMLVLPRESFGLLPKALALKKKDELLEFYPQNFILDIVQGTKFIYSEPILPDIPLDLIRKRILCNEKLFSENERNRNTIRKRPFIYNPIHRESFTKNTTKKT